MRRQFSRHVQDAARGMRQRDRPRMKMQAPALSHALDMGGGTTVFAVVEDRRAERRRMSAALMRPPGQRPPRQPGELRPGLVTGLVEGERESAVLGTGVYGGVNT